MGPLERFKIAKFSFRSNFPTAFWVLYEMGLKYDNLPEFRHIHTRCMGSAYWPVHSISECLRYRVLYSSRINCMTIFFFTEKGPQYRSVGDCQQHYLFECMYSLPAVTSDIVQCIAWCVIALFWKFFVIEIRSFNSSCFLWDNSLTKYAHKTPTC